MGFSRYWKKAKRQVKQSSRQAMVVHSKAQKVLRPLAVAAGGFFGGAAGAALVGGITHYGQQYTTSAAARYKGLSGHEAREAGRSAAQKTTTISMIAGGVGMLGSGVASALAGKNIITGTFLGQGGSELVGAGSIFSASPTPMAGAPSTGLESAIYSLSSSPGGTGPAATAALAEKGLGSAVFALDPVTGAVAVPTAAGAGGTAGALAGLGAMTLSQLYGPQGTGSPQNGGAVPPFGGAGGGGYEGANGSYPVGSLDGDGRQSTGGVSMGMLAAMAIGALVLMKG